jgi:hypothetical protein
VKEKREVEEDRLLVPPPRRVFVVDVEALAFGLVSNAAASFDLSVNFFLVNTVLVLVLGKERHSLVQSKTRRG